MKLCYDILLSVLKTFLVYHQVTLEIFGRGWVLRIAEDFTSTTKTAMTSTADFVKKARQRLKLTQAQLAEALGLERRSIVRFEKGEELPLQTRLAIERLVEKRKRKSSTKKMAPS